MVDHSKDMTKYAPQADAKHVAAIVQYCGIALQQRDSSLVAASDPVELARVRDGFAKKKLGLADDTAIDAAIAKVCETMKGDHNKSRVAFYYLLAQQTGTLDKLG